MTDGGTGTATADDRSAEGSERRPAGGAGARWALRAVVALGVAVPAVRMARVVRGSSRLQYNDYWPMIVEVLGPDGGLDVQALFTLRNEHPIAVPKLMYWVNARLFDGSNLTLGAGVIVVALLTVGLVALLARGTPELRRVHVAILAVAAAALLLSPRGTWYYVKAMSGSAWLTANLFVVAALVAQSRGRRWVAVALGVVASFSYGTGLAVWPALLVAGVLTDRSLRRRWPTVVAAAAVGAWYYDQHRQLPDDPWAVPPTLVERVETMLMTIGAFVRPEADGATTAIGGVVVGLGAVMAVSITWRALRPGPTGDGDPAPEGASRPSAGAAAWVGLLTAALGAGALLTGTSRFYVDITQSRYAVFGAMAGVSVVGLVATVASGTVRPVAPGAGASATRSGLRTAVVALFAVGAVVVGLRGGEVTDELRAGRALQDSLEVALQLDLADGQRYWQGGYEDLPHDLGERLRSTGQVPFDGRDGLGCGLIGREVDPDDLDPSAPLDAELLRFPESPVADAEFLFGHIDVGSDEVECLIVLADTDRVRGSGAVGQSDEGYGVGQEPREGRVFFQVLARRAETLWVWARLEGDDRFRLVGEAEVR